MMFSFLLNYIGWRWRRLPAGWVVEGRDVFDWAVRFRIFVFCIGVVLLVFENKMQPNRALDSSDRGCQALVEGLGDSIQYFRPSPRRNLVPGGVFAFRQRLWNARLLGLEKYWLGRRPPRSQFRFSQIGSEGFGMKQ
jgi:hypothetical protein